jgi:hypothetical protein
VFIIITSISLIWRIEGEYSCRSGIRDKRIRDQRIKGSEDQGIIGCRGM